MWCWHIGQPSHLQDWWPDPGIIITMMLSSAHSPAAQHTPASVIRRTSQWRHSAVFLCFFSCSSHILHLISPAKLKLATMAIAFSVQNINNFTFFNQPPFYVIHFDRMKRHRWRWSWLSYYLIVGLTPLEKVGDSRYLHIHKHLIILRNDEGNFTNGGSNEKDGITNDISSYNIPVGGSRPH